MDRTRALAICVALIGLVFSQSSGQIVGDTKLDLSVDPSRFLDRALHLWDPSAGFGQLQDQAYGYAFPMGPFFALGHLVGFPAWEVQRAWQAALLVAAFLGMRALARRMGIGTPTTRLLGGLLFALSPLLISELGPLSAEAATECLAPWVLLPLVGEQARVRPRRAAACSGVAVLFVGGVNASATLAVLVLPALWLLSHPRGRARRQLITWWVAAVLCATLWWALPLVILGHYSPPFTDWIESAATTTSTTSLLAALSGTENWVGHLTTSSGPIWRAAWQLATNRVAILDEAVLAGLGLAGLTRRSLPHRRLLLTGALLGLTLICIGHAAATGANLSSPARTLLDGPLSAFRNVQKFDLVLRVPLVLAAVHVVTDVTTTVSARPRAVLRRAAVRPVAVLALVALVGVGLPLWNHQLEPAGSFSALPSWWPQTASWLKAHDDGSRALLLPASSHGDYAWGLPEDEPLQALATTTWAVRSALPLGGAGEARLLDAIDEQVETGQGSPGLGAYLARAGVGWLVVRNDLDPNVENLVPPAVVAAALQNSPGISLAAGIGPNLGDAGTGPGVLADGVSVSVPAVQIYRVSGVVARASTQPVAGTERISGGVESLLPLIDHGLLSPDTATVMAQGDTQQTADQQRVVTDGNRHAEVNFGTTTDIYSATLLPGEPYAFARAVHDYETSNPAGHQTTAEVFGARFIRASSSASDADAFWVSDPAAGPVSAFDGDPNTSWISGGLTAVGQWVEEDLYGDPAPSDILLSAPVLVASPAVSVRVDTDAGSETVPVGPVPQLFPLPAGRTTKVRVTVVGVLGGGAGRVTSVKATLPGLPPSVGLVVPSDATTPATADSPAFVFQALPQDDGCVVLQTPQRTVCSPTLVSRSEDNTGLDRTVTVTGPTHDSFTGTAVARGGAALDAALPSPAGLQLSVSSKSVDSAADGALALVDGNLATGWRAASDDPHPSITATVSTARTLTSLRLQTPPSLAASPAQRVVVTTDDGRLSQSADVGADGVAVLSHPLTGRTFVITPITDRVRGSVGPFGASALPVGVAELQLSFTHGPATGTVAGSTPVREACGLGPLLSVDGTVVPTSVIGTVEQVMAGQDLTVTACGQTGAQIALAAGSHRIRLLGTGSMRVTSMVLLPAPLTQGTTTRSVSIQTWGSASRLVTVGGGAASYLETTENYNAGWHAELNGHALVPVQLDGWKQAFLLPAGAGGVVHLTFAPDRVFRAALLVGGLLALLLVGAALWRQRALELSSLRTRPTPRGGRRRLLARRAGIVAPLLAAPLLFGVAGAIALAVVGLALALGRRRAARWAELTGVAAGALVVVAGVISLQHPFGGSAPARPYAIAIDVLCAAAVAAVSITGFAASGPAEPDGATDL